MSTSKEKVPGSLDMERVGGVLFRTAAEGLVVVDRAGVIVMHNPRLDTMFGYNKDELSGRTIEILIPEAIRGRHKGHREKYNEKPVERFMGIGMELNGQRKDGTVFPVEVSLNHFKVDDQQFAMGLVTDITLRHEAEVVLRRSKQELEELVQQRTAELKSAERSVREALVKERELHALKSRFVSMASHEFRTPLSTIMSSVDLIGRYTEKTGDEKVDKHLGRIRGKVREMTAMLNEFLSLERIEQGQVQCNPTTFDIVDLCIELMEELRQLAKPGQALDYDHTAAERNVLSDRQMLSNVISNLVTNAIKYSPENKPIELRSHIEGCRLVITVRDEGIGIPPEDQQHLFERFFRGSNATTIQGTGLGLNLVKRYLDHLEGIIDLNSGSGNTKFTVTLPQNLAT
ncbi:MAG: PAS domain S-box protein [Flavobacteriales bacterium]|nr:PAS domain S-box protein [Flavobacteriales bacterium]